MGKLAINHNPVRHCRLRCSKLQFAHVHCCAHKRFLYCDCQHLYLHVLLNSRWTCDKSLHSLFPLLRCFWLVHNSTHISNTIICCWVHPATCITVCKLQLLLRQEQSAPEARCPLQIISIDLGLVFGGAKQRPTYASMVNVELASYVLVSWMAHRISCSRSSSTRRHDLSGSKRLLYGMCPLHWRRAKQIGGFAGAQQAYKFTVGDH